ncbi:MAG: hypothetical protein EBR28_03255 [Planctomycetia bacterium]|nr:hypothetical protein [Planctomycetia bacterium]
MAKTLEDLQKILSDKGYPCRRILDLCVMAELPTQTCTNAKGAKTIEVQITFDEKKGCLTMDTPWLRVDCSCGKDGIEEDRVMKMLSLIPEFADAMNTGRFEQAAKGPPPAESRLESIARRAGGVNRLAALLRMQHRNN